MRRIPVIQYLPLTRPLASRGLIKKLNAANVHSILDLEDSAQNIFDKEETRQFKKDARNGLLSMSDLFDYSITTNIYIRVNSMDTEFFEDDIKAVLKACENGMPIKGVFLPMVRSYSQVERLNQLLSKSAHPLEIVPMIETVKGVKQLTDMLKKDKTNNLFSRVHYGHFDYSADAKLWPFPDPYHNYFWELITPIVKQLAAYKKSYVHTPFPFPQDESLFWESAYHLSLIEPDLEVWACTVNAGLSLLAQPKKIPQLEIKTYNFSKEQRIAEAVKIQEHFMAGRSIKRSFGVKENRFIPPHQYVIAKNYLKNN